MVIQLGVMVVQLGVMVLHQGVMVVHQGVIVVRRKKEKTKLNYNLDGVAHLMKD